MKIPISFSLKLTVFSVNFHKVSHRKFMYNIPNELNNEIAFFQMIRWAKVLFEFINKAYFKKHFYNRFKSKKVFDTITNSLQTVFTIYLELQINAFEIENIGF